MNEFDLLRAKAKEQRDAEITLAKQDYRQAISQIATLQKAMLGKPRRGRSKRRPSTVPTTLREVIAAVLGNRQMTKTEIVVGVLESGYRTTMARQELCKRVAWLLKTDGRFKRAGERWTVQV